VDSDKLKKWAKLFDGPVFSTMATNPKTSQFAAQKDLCAKIAEIKGDPKTLEKHLEDGRIKTLIQVLLNEDGASEFEAFNLLDEPPKWVESKPKATGLKPPPYKPVVQNTKYAETNTIFSNIRLGKAEIVKSIIKNDPMAMFQTDEFGYTPIHFAAQKGRVEIIRILLAESADVNIKSAALGYTPLHLAVMESQYSAIKILLDAGANTLITDAEKNTPLEYALRNKSEDLITLLLDYQTSQTWDAPARSEKTKAIVEPPTPIVAKIQETPRISTLGKNEAKEFPLVKFGTPVTMVNNSVTPQPTDDGSLVARLIELEALILKKKIMKLLRKIKKLVL